MKFEKGALNNFQAKPEICYILEKATSVSKLMKCAQIIRMKSSAAALSRYCHTKSLAEFESLISMLLSFHTHTRTNPIISDPANSYCIISIIHNLLCPLPETRSLLPNPSNQYPIIAILTCIWQVNLAINCTHSLKKIFFPSFSP